MTMPPAPDIAAMSLAEVAQALADKRLPPVERWTPTHCGDSEMRIARDGTWHHMGSPIGREAMVRLFSTILRREADGGFVLVTPVEKLDIVVEDAPFIAVAMRQEGSGREQRLIFQTNLGELVALDQAHPLRIVAGGDGPRPYLTVRPGLEARLARPVYYELAAMALADDASDAPGVWSAGHFFPLEPQ